MGGDVGGQLGQLPVEPVPPGDLEGHPGHLPRPAGHRQRLVHPADLEHEDPVGAAGHRPADRDRVHDAAVEVVLPVDLRRAQQPGDRGRGDHRVDHPAAGEPVLGGPLDAGRAALERHRELLEGQVAELLGEPVPQRLGRVQVGAGPDGPGDLAERAVAVHLAVAHRALPQADQPVDHAGAGVGGHQGAVQRADRGAQDQVRADAGLEERPEHADLDRAEQAATAQDEGRGAAG